MLGSVVSAGRFIFDAVQYGRGLQSSADQRGKREALEKVAQELNIDLPFGKDNKLTIMHDDLATNSAEFICSLKGNVSVIEAYMAEQESEERKEYARNRLVRQRSSSMDVPPPPPMTNSFVAALTLNMDSDDFPPPPPPPPPQSSNESVLVEQQSNGQPDFVPSKELQLMFDHAQNLKSSIDRCCDLIFSNFNRSTKSWLHPSNLLWVVKKHHAREENEKAFRESDKRIHDCMQVLNDAKNNYAEKKRSQHEKTLSKLQEQQLFAFQQHLRATEDAFQRSLQPLSQEAQAFEQRRLCQARDELEVYQSNPQKRSALAQAEQMDLVEFEREFKLAANQAIECMNHRLTGIQSSLANIENQVQATASDIKEVLDNQKLILRRMLEKEEKERRQQEMRELQQAAALQPPISPNANWSSGSGAFAAKTLRYGSIPFIRFEDLINPVRVSETCGKGSFSTLFRATVELPYEDSHGKTKRKVVVCFKQFDKVALLHKYRADVDAAKAARASAASSSASSSQTIVATAHETKMDQDLEPELQPIYLEAKAHQLVGHHENCLSLLAICLEPDNHRGFAFPWSDYGSLRRWLWQPLEESEVEEGERVYTVPLHPLPVSLNGRAVLHVTRALSECHRIGMRHRDLKSDNVLLWKGSADAPLAPDFGVDGGAVSRPLHMPRQRSFRPSALGHALTVTNPHDWLFTLIDFGNSAFERVVGANVTASITTDVAAVGHTFCFAPPEILLLSNKKPKQLAAWQQAVLNHEAIVNAPFMQPIEFDPISPTSVSSTSSSALQSVTPREPAKSEVSRDVLLSHAVDIYGWACMMCEVLFRCPPYANSSSEADITHELKSYSPPYDLSVLTSLGAPKLHHLLYNCFHVIPTRRPTMKYISEQLGIIMAEMESNEFQKAQQGWTTKPATYVRCSLSTVGEAVSPEPILEDPAAKSPSNTSSTHAASYTLSKWQPVLPHAPSSSSSTSIQPPQYPPFPFDPFFPSELDILERSLPVTNAQGQVKWDFEGKLYDEPYGPFPPLMNKSDFDPLTRCSMRGYLLKRSPSFSEKLQRRYAVLFRYRLLFFQDEECFRRWCEHRQRWYENILKWRTVMHHVEPAKFNHAHKEKKKREKDDPLKDKYKPSTVLPFVVSVAELPVINSKSYFAIQTFVADKNWFSKPHRKYWNDHFSMQEYMPSLHARVLQLRVDSNSSSERDEWLTQLRQCLTRHVESDHAQATLETFRNACLQQTAVYSAISGEEAESTLSWASQGLSKATKDGDQDIQVQTILAIGLPNAGKSCLYNSVKEILGSPFGEAKKNEFKASMHFNMLQTAKAVIRSMSAEELSSLTFTQQQAHKALLSANGPSPLHPPKGGWDGKTGYLDPHLAESFDIFWRETLHGNADLLWRCAQQQSQVNRAESNQDPTQYDGFTPSVAFFYQRLTQQITHARSSSSSSSSSSSKISTLLSPDYVMTLPDILHCRVPTHGEFSRLRFTAGEQAMQWLDVGGHTSEQAALESQLSTVAVSVFLLVISLNDWTRDVDGAGYDMLERATALLHPLLRVNEENSKAQVMLCLNKYDLLSDSFAHPDGEEEFRVAFPDWEGRGSRSAAHHVASVVVSMLTHLKTVEQVSAVVVTAVNPTSVRPTFAHLIHSSRMHNMQLSDLGVPPTFEEIVQEWKTGKHLNMDSVSDLVLWYVPTVSSSVGDDRFKWRANIRRPGMRLKFETHSPSLMDDLKHIVVVGDNAVPVRIVIEIAGNSFPIYRRASDQVTPAPDGDKILKDDKGDGMKLLGKILSMQNRAAFSLMIACPESLIDAAKRFTIEVSHKKVTIAKLIESREVVLAATQIDVADWVRSVWRDGTWTHDV